MSGKIPDTEKHEEIVTYIKKNPGRGAAEISDALELHPNVFRAMLTTIEARGRALFYTEQNGKGPGYFLYREWPEIRLFQSDVEVEYV